MTGTGTTRPAPRAGRHGGSGLTALAGLGWCLVCAAVVWFAAQDVGLEAQYLLAALGLVAVALLHATRRPGLLRVFLILTVAFVSVRYFAWRTLETIPDWDSAGFAPGLLLYFAELQGMWVYLLGVFVNIRPVDRRIDPLDLTGDVPTVDIFIPTYNEPVSLLRNTVTAALAVTYPAERKRVYVLDDGGTDQKLADPDPAKAAEARQRARLLKKMCAELGATYLTRPRNERAKAGNLNAALPRSSGEFIVVLDADHVPTRDFLVNTIKPLVDDPELFLVQTPHFFETPDPVERNLNTFGTQPSENEMFYAGVQKGLDSWNGTFFCGSAAVLRRSHLMMVGGIAGETITEDAETALELHARGLKSLYIDKPMVAGLSPDTFAAFVQQRIRWAQGMTQILILKNPLLKRGLTLGQRLCYLNSATFWLFPFARLIFLIAPLFYLLFGLKVFNATLEEFVGFAVAHVVCSLMLSNFLFGRTRRPFMSDLYEMVQSPFTFPALLSVLRNPRKPEFKVTPKAETVNRDFLSQLGAPFLLLLGLLVIAALIGLYRYQAMPLERDHLMIVAAWNTINIALVLGACGAVFERAVRGKFGWVIRNKPVNLVTFKGAARGRIVSMTPDAARIEISADHAAAVSAADGHAAIQVVLPDREEVRTFRLHVTGQEIARGRLTLTATFTPDDDAERADLVALCYGDSAAWAEFQARRRRRTTILGGLLGIAGRGAGGVAALTRAWLRGDLREADTTQADDDVVPVLLRLPRS